MKILTIDIGTGTQDIHLFDSRLCIENGFKLILPSPTMIIHRRIKEATRRGEPILLSGVMMGGGPNAWAAEAHAHAGFPVYATPEAAKTINDELDKVEKKGIKLVSEDEAKRLPSTVHRMEFRDLDLPAIWSTFETFGVSLKGELTAVAAAVFDHGDAPPGVSDRQFRFDYLDECLKRKNSLSAFAYLASEIPPIMTRLQSVAHSAGNLDCPLIVMDTAPAAVLGATFDPFAAARQHKIIVNVGNFHTIAFKLDGKRIEGVFEHHTGEIDRPKLESYIRALADGTLKHADIFDDMGHGALVYPSEPLPVGKDEFDIIVTGPRRSLFAPIHPSSFTLHPYFASPYGDMMLAGNIGLLSATADLLPELDNDIHAALSGKISAVAPWDAP